MELLSQLNKLNIMMKQIIKKCFTFLLLPILILSFNSCQKEAPKPTMDAESSYVNFKKDGYTINVEKTENIFGFKASSNKNHFGSEEYVMTVSNNNLGKTVSAHIIKEKISSNNYDYNLYHYDSNGFLIATILIRNNAIKDILINEYNTPFVSNSLASGVKLAKNDSKYEGNCFTNGYKKYKEFYTQGDWKEVLCDIGNIFGGSCTVGGVLKGALSCL